MISHYFHYHILLPNPPPPPPPRHCKIEKRLNYVQNLKTIILTVQASQDSGNVPFQKILKYADYASSATFTKRAKIKSFFQIMPEIMLAQPISTCFGPPELRHNSW